jgi:lipoprotein-anchoring transpeptidase ErfK/SrfK
VRRISLLAAAAILMAAAAPASAAPSPSRWAHPKSAAPIYKSPGGARTGKLHLRTEDDFREVYLVTATKGRNWVRVRVPQRPNGSTGWVKRSALGSIKTTRASIVVDRKALRVTLYEAGDKVWSARVGVGTPSTPTPAGKFWIREVFRVNGNAAYGPYAIGTSAYSVLSDWPGGGVIGLHGTDQPGLVPGRPSHGCVRLKNKDIAWLATHVRIGTPITIR